MKKKKTAWKKYAAMAFMMLIGAACGILMVTYMENFSAEQSLFEGIASLILLFIGMYAAMMFHLILHEAGHLVFGLLSGYGFCSFRIFSFMWVREEGKIRLKRFSLAGTGGQCLMSPPDRKEGRFPLVLYNLGGSILNALAAAVFLTAHFLCPAIPLVKTGTLLFAVFGFVLAVINGVPMRMGMVDNDGYNAFSLGKNAQAAEAFWVQLKVNELTSKGVRLKDMPAEWFQMPPDESMKNSMIAVRGVFACNRLIDEKRFDEAEKMISHMLQTDTGMVGIHRNLLILDRMFLLLIAGAPTETIGNMLTKELKSFMKAMKTFPSVIRSEYALCLLFEKDVEKARKIKDRFEKCAKSYPYPTDIDSERELMALAEEKSARDGEITA